MPSSVVGLALAAAWLVIAVAVVESILRVVDGVTRVDSTAATSAALPLGPRGLAAFHVIGLCVPAQRTFEPRGAAETVNITVIGLCTAAAVMLIRTARRAIRMLAASHSFVRRLAVSEQLVGGDAQMPVLVVEDAFPVAMLVGIMSPKIIIARRFKDALTRAELQAVLGNEMAHHARRDNLTRFALECVPAVWSAHTEQLTGRWREASDVAADARLANGDSERAIALASALVKACRFSEMSSRRLPVSSSVCSGAPVASRVTRLLEDDLSPRASVRRRVRWVGVGAALAAVGVYPSALIVVHHASEWLLNGLP